MTIKHLTIVILLFFICSCAGILPKTKTGADVDRASSLSIDQWIDEDLIPYLTKQLTQHPRFKGQPFLILGLNGEDIQANIDDLTYHIREKVVDALLAKPGIHITRRPSINSVEHQRHLRESACAPLERIKFYIGIDTAITSVNRQLQVKVRALDTDENTWISGFGRWFNGEPTIEQIVAVQHKRKDESLRGLRPLPFTPRQPDLVASYLAQNLSCLFRQYDMDEIVAYVSSESKQGNEFFDTVTDLLGAYLSQFREVSIAKDIEDANVVINTEIQAIDEELYQIRASARHKDQGTFLTGVETQTYVVFDAKANNEVYKSCGAETVTHGHNTGLFLISQDADGRLTRLFPSDCGSLSDLPLDADRIYSVLVTDPLLFTWFDDKTRHLRGLCRKGDTHVKTASHTSIYDFQQYLDFLREKTNGKLVFRIVAMDGNVKGL